MSNDPTMSESISTVKGFCPAGCGETLVLDAERRVVCGAEDCRFPNLYTEDMAKSPDFDLREGVRLRITADGALPFHVRIYLDEKEIVGVEDLKLLLNPNHINKVQLRLPVDALDIDADVMVEAI